MGRQMIINLDRRSVWIVHSMECDIEIRKGRVVTKHGGEDILISDATALNRTRLMKGGEYWKQAGRTKNDMTNR